jgi:hypothetical protein
VERLHLATPSKRGMPSKSLPHSRPTRRTVPWLLATLTMAFALAGPAYADSDGADELQEAEAMLAAEVPEVPMEAPPEVPEPAPEPAAEAPESEPAPAPEPEPPPAEEAVTFGATDQAEPAEPDPAEEVATEPPAYISDEPTPVIPDEDDVEAVDEDDADTGAPTVAIPVNLNVDIRILSPGDDGDVTQIIDLGGLGGGDPSDVLGGLGPGDLDLGLDWTWDWNWEWDCGDASVAGLDWNWTWTWSGDCAAGILGEPGHGAGSLGDRLPGSRYNSMLDSLTRDALGAPPEIGDEAGPLVSTPGAGGGTHARSHGSDDTESSPAATSPPSGGGPWVPSDALTSFVSTGATSQSRTATAPARRPAGADPNGDPERQPAGPPPAQAMAIAAAGGGGGGGGALTVLLLAALVGALALVPPPPGGRVTAIQKKLSSLLSSSRLERPG